MGIAFDLSTLNIQALALARLSSRRHPAIPVIRHFPVSVSLSARTRRDDGCQLATASLHRVETAGSPDTVLGMVAEMELGFIRDRQRVGIDAAKAKGIYRGRPATFDRGRIVSLRKEGMGATEIAKVVGCKRGNVYKTLKAAGLN
jgi:hypothetical protein